MNEHGKISHELLNEPSQISHEILNVHNEISHMSYEISYGNSDEAKETN